jgi:hypothetical protein
MRKCQHSHHFGKNYGPDCFANQIYFVSLLRSLTHKNKYIMARPIKDTPIISGDDARRFTEAMENVVPLPQEEREEIKKAYEWFKSRAKFPMP